MSVIEESNKSETMHSVRIVLRSFDHVVLDSAVGGLLDAVRKQCNAVCKSVVPLPTSIKKISANRSTHCQGSSKEQFELRMHSRLILLNMHSGDLNSAIMKIDMPAAVDICVKC